LPLLPSLSIGHTTRLDERANTRQNLVADQPTSHGSLVHTVTTSLEIETITTKITIALAINHTEHLITLLDPRETSPAIAAT
jgi:hypothetical protein